MTYALRATSPAVKLTYLKYSLGRTETQLFINLDCYFLLFGFLYLGKRYFQHTLVECRLNLVGLHVDWEPKGTLERPVASLNAMIMFVFLSLFLLLYINRRYRIGLP